MVDDVVLYDAKVQSVKQRYQDQIKDLNESAEFQEKKAIEEMMSNELSQISLRAVPNNK
jgi:hypothetical protein